MEFRAPSSIPQQWQGGQRRTRPQSMMLAERDSKLCKSDMDSKNNSEITTSIRRDPPLPYWRKKTLCSKFLWLFLTCIAAAGAAVLLTIQTDLPQATKRTSKLKLNHAPLLPFAHGFQICAAAGRRRDRGFQISASAAGRREQHHKFLKQLAQSRKKARQQFSPSSSSSSSPESIMSSLTSAFTSGSSEAVKSPSQQQQQRWQQQQPKAARRSLKRRTTDGLSKFHRSILSRTQNRQRFVTGRYPVTVRVTENPTRQWLGQAETEIWVNGTACDRSLASWHGRSQWLYDDDDNDDDGWNDRVNKDTTTTSPGLVDQPNDSWIQQHSIMSAELIAEIHMERPGYLQILPADVAPFPFLLSDDAAVANKNDHKEPMDATAAASSSSWNGAAGSTAAAALRASNTGDLSWNRWKRQQHAAALQKRLESKQQPSQFNLFESSSSSGKKTSLDFFHDQTNDQDDKHDPPRDRLWVTGFTLAGSSRGLLKFMDCTETSGEDDDDDDYFDECLLYAKDESECSTSLKIQSVNQRTAGALLWPNEVHPVPKDLILKQYQQQKKPSFAEDEKELENQQQLIHQQQIRNLKQLKESIVKGKTQSTTTLTLIKETPPLQQSSSSSSSSTLAVASSSSSPAAPPVPSSYQDALLVCDGFLVPGRDRGGLYIVRNPGNPKTEWTVRLTEPPYKSTSTTSTGTSGTTSSNGNSDSNRWFYHRAVWVDLTNDGRLSLLTARTQISARRMLRKRKTTRSKNSNNIDEREDDIPVTSGLITEGELVWLECPKPASVHPDTGTLLEADGTIFDPFASRHLPWKEHVLAKGPDVMFALADMDPSDDTIEVISSQFFQKRVVVHSIQRGPRPKVTFQRVIDDRCGAAFGAILAQLDTNGIANVGEQGRQATVIDSGSTVTTTKPGDSFSHVLVTSHECSYAEKDLIVDGRSSAGGDAKQANHGITANTGATTDHAFTNTEGGSLFAYRVPRGSSEAWKTDPWVRTTIASGFKVQGQIKNMINPGAPGFVYTFYPRFADTLADRAQLQRPMIAVAGDCAESAYLFRPDHEVSPQPREGTSEKALDPSTQYKLVAEIQCGATVGSIGVGYGSFGTVPQDDGYAKLYIPCYEKDKVLVFALGSVEDEEEDDGW